MSIFETYYFWLYFKRRGTTQIYIKNIDLDLYTYALHSFNAIFQLEQHTSWIPLQPITGISDENRLTSHISLNSVVNKGIM